MSVFITRPPVASQSVPFYGISAVCRRIRAWGWTLSLPILCFCIRASLCSLIIRLTDATCDRFYFLSICVFYMFRASSAHHQESLNCAYSLQFPVLMSVSFLQDSAADRYQHRKLEAVCTVKVLLMMSA
jgi:hypothetical protein